MERKQLIMVMSAVLIVSVIAVTVVYVEVLDKADVNIEVTDGGSATGAGTYSKGESVILTATPDYGYHFEGWYINGELVSYDLSYTISVGDSNDIKAVFQKETYTLTISQNYDGGIVGGSGSYVYGSEVTVSTTLDEGYGFVGWTEDGVLISDEMVFSYEIARSLTIVANYSIIHDASFVVSMTSTTAPSTLTISSTYDVEVEGRTWTISDGITEGSLYGSSNPGISSFKYSVSSCRILNVTQAITYSDGQKSTSTQIVMVDGIAARSFTWKYQSDDALMDHLATNDESATLNLSPLFSWYYGCASDDIPRGYQKAIDRLSEYTYPDGYIVSIASSLTELTLGMSDIGRVNCVLKFVQSIQYEYDIDGKGVREYYKYPAETIWEQKGDCEDHAILFTSLMRAMGYNVVMVNCVGHMTAAVNVVGGSGNYITHDGENYYYCESTYCVGNETINYGNVGYSFQNLQVRAVIEL